MKQKSTENERTGKRGTATKRGKRTGGSPKNGSVQLEQQQKLLTALRLLSESARFEMVSALQIGPFLTTPVTTPTVTLAALIEDPTTAAAVIAELSTEDRAKILATLRTLAPDTVTDAAIAERQTEQTKSEPAQAPAGEKRVTAIPLRPAPETRRMGSVESDQKLTAALNKLKGSAQLVKHGDRTVAEFWDPSWPPAPFEQALTLKQITSLAPRALLEKRSFTEQKLVHLLAALERAVTSEPNAAASLSAESVAGAPQGAGSASAPANASLTALPAHWVAALAPLPAHLRAAASGLCAPTLPHEPAFLGSFSRLSLSVTAPEYLAMLMAVDSDTQQIASSLRVDHDGAKPLLESGYRKLGNFLSAELPLVAAAIRSAVAGVGCTIEHLHALVAPQYSEPSSRTLTMLQLSAAAFGAAPVSAFGHPLAPTVLSATPTGVESLLKMLITALPKRDPELRREFAVLAPGIPFAAVEQLLARVAFFNQKEELWASRA